MSCNITWAGSPNYNSRNGKKIIAIVNHITSGSMPGCLSWLRNPAAKASAHYLVARDGAIYQLVKEGDAAWHAGIVNRPSWPLYDGTNPNRYTLGIEHEGTDGSLTEAQYQATLWLHRQLIAKYNLPVDNNHIIGHYRIDSVNRANCPGPNFPWTRLLNDLKGVDNMAIPAWKAQVVNDATKAGLINQYHNPNEPADKAFVLAVCLNLMKRLEGKK